MRRLVGWFRVVSQSVGWRGYVERVTPIFGRTDINTLPLSDVHEKSLCFQYLWELLFLCLTPDFCHSLVSVLWSRFSIISLTEYIAVAVMPVRVLPPFCIRVWDYPNKRKRTRPGRGRGGPFFGSVATLSMLATLVSPLLFFLCLSYIYSVIE